MLNVNLLPKQQKDETEQRQLQSLLMAILSIVAILSVALTAFLYVQSKILQPRTIDDLRKETDDAIAKINEEPEIDKLLTLQNQLIALPKLHDSKPVASRLFSYLDKAVPHDVDLTSVEILFSSEDLTSTSSGIDDGGGSGFSEASSVGSIMTISGESGDFKSMNTFVDILKNAQYKVKNEEVSEEDLTEKSNELKKTFSEVRITGSSKQSDGRVQFSVSMNYDPTLFNFTVDQVLFSVPNITTTVSERERPTGLFIEDTSDEEGQGE